MTSTHTPGPWHVNTLGPARIIYDSTKEGWAIADVKTYHGRFTPEEIEANARLIASAPTLAAENERLRAEKAELLAALHATIVASGRGTKPRDDDPNWVRNARAALAKATGGTE